MVTTLMLIISFCASLNVLPDEILQHTATMLQDDDLIEFSGVSRRINRNANVVILDRIRNDYASIFNIYPQLEPTDIVNNFQRMKQTVKGCYNCIFEHRTSKNYGYLCWYMLIKNGSMEFLDCITAPFLSMRLKFTRQDSMTNTISKVAFIFESNGNIKAYNLNDITLVNVNPTFVANLIYGNTVEYHGSQICVYQNHDNVWNRITDFCTGIDVRMHSMDSRALCLANIMLLIIICVLVMTLLLKTRS